MWDQETYSFSRLERPGGEGVYDYEEHDDEVLQRSICRSEVQSFGFDMDLRYGIGFKVKRYLCEWDVSHIERQAQKHGLPAMGVFTRHFRTVKFTFYFGKDLPWHHVYLHHTSGRMLSVRCVLADMKVILGCPQLVRYRKRTMQAKPWRFRFSPMDTVDIKIPRLQYLAVFKLPYQKIQYGFDEAEQKEAAQEGIVQPDLLLRDCDYEAINEFKPRKF